MTMGQQDTVEILFMVNVEGNLSSTWLFMKNLFEQDLTELNASMNLAGFRIIVV